MHWCVLHTHQVAVHALVCTAHSPSGGACTGVYCTLTKWRCMHWCVLHTHQVAVHALVCTAHSPSGGACTGVYCTLTKWRCMHWCVLHTHQVAVHALVCTAHSPSGGACTGVYCTLTDALIPRRHGPKDSLHNGAQEGFASVGGVRYVYKLPVIISSYSTYVYSLVVV